MMMRHRLNMRSMWLAALASILVSAGLALDTWWPIAAGMLAGMSAAWRTMELS